jgi:hypothetical protein
MGSAYSRYGFDKIEKWFPRLLVKQLDENDFEISGDIQVNGTWKDFSLDEKFSVKIVAKDYPRAIPICIETSGKVKDYHVNPTESKNLCLTSHLSIYKKLKKNSSIISYINELVIPFFVSFRYYEMYNISPFGELRHGGSGILDEYKEIFKTDNITTCILLTYGTSFLYRGHHLCPCGSNLQLRKCHGGKVRDLFDFYPLLMLASDISDIYNCLHALEKQNFKLDSLKQRCNVVDRVMKTFKK